MTGNDGVVEFRRWNPDDAEGYASASGVEPESEKLDADDIGVEEIMLSLRTAEGISRSLIPESATLRMLESGDLELMPGDRLRIPESRFFVSDAIIRDIVSEI